MHENGVVILDKTLERIISLIPKKENGDFKYGALKEFANSIGLKSGNLLSDWIAGRSVSYNSYVYEIAAKYNVSIEWLKGETDDPSAGIKKEHPADSEALNDAQNEIMEIVKRLKTEDLQKAKIILQTIVGE